MDTKGFTLTQLLEMYPGSVPLTHRALRQIQQLTKWREKSQHGVAIEEDVKSERGYTFRVVSYWLILKSGSMLHSWLPRHSLTPTGGLRRKRNEHVT